MNVCIYIQIYNIYMYICIQFPIRLPSPQPVSKSKWAAKTHRACKHSTQPLRQSARTPQCRHCLGCIYIYIQSYIQQPIPNMLHIMLTIHILNGSHLNSIGLT